MRQYIEYIFNLDYTQFVLSNDSPELIKTFHQLEDDIRPLAKEGMLQTESSVGGGSMAKIPWVRIYDYAEASTAQKGVYIVYLFSKNGDSVFLTLNQGVKGSNSSEIAEIKKKIQEKVDPKDFNCCKEKIEELGSYSKSKIFFKKYNRDSLPSDDEMQKDLRTAINIYKDYLIMKNNGTTEKKENPVQKITGNQPLTLTISNKVTIPRKSNNNFSPFQKIIFGAPGTGKSFKIDDPEKGYSLKNAEESRKFRTTFHPDYDYAQFIGAYKPRKKDDNQDIITYDFVPQVFAKAYAAAWNQYFSASDALTAEDQVYLVIEEINRGNCAQIFGDIFQLLDRINDGEDKGFSQYSIDADSDFAEWLKTNSILNEKSIWMAYEKWVGEDKLKLPPNFNILATMNTSDQSLFPMDSAFKRRFDWEYVPINYEHPDAKFEIKIGDKSYKWLEFLKVVNKNVYDVTKSEDKQMGEFFIKHSVGYKEFRSKVLFYLWDSVYKDEVDNTDATVFQIENGKFITFQNLFEGDEDVQKNLIKKIMSNLGVAEQGEPRQA